MKVRALVLVGALLCAVTACGSDDKGATEAPTTASTATTTAPAPSTTVATTDAAPATTAATTEATEPPLAPLDPPVHVKFAVNGLAPEAGIYVAQERGYFKDEGLDVELVPLRRFSEALPLLATGGLDYATGGPNPDMFNAKSSGVDIKIVAANAIGVPGSAPAALVMRQDHIDDGSFKDLSSLKGMTIALNGLGSSSQLHVEKMLAKGGLTKDDVQLVALGFADMPAALTNKAVDAVFAVEPFVNNMVKAGLGKSVAVGDQTFPGAINQVLVMSPAFAEKNPEAAKRMMYAFLKGQRDYLDAFITGKNPSDQAAIIEILTKHTALTDPAAYAGMGMSGGDPDGKFDLNVLKEFQDYFVSEASVKDPVADLTSIVDFSYVEDAAKRLDAGQ